MLRTSAFLLGTLLAAAPATAPAQEQISELLRRGTAPIRSERVHERIWVSGGNSNAYRIVTDAGSVIFDTGLSHQAADQKAALEAAAPGPVRYVILSHAHGDHTGGAELWREAGAKVVAHRLFLQRAADRERLTEFSNRGDSILWGPVLETMESYRAVEPDVIVDERWGFELGGLSFEVLHTAGAEGPDGISLWIPEIRALFTGDLFGPIMGKEMFPNLFTLRGENLREAQPYIETLERVLELEPEIVLPGHFEPVFGAEKLQTTIRRVRDTVRYVHDATVAGMNEGRSLWELMREVKLPPELAVNEQYGRVPWGVRAIWESYTGWFRKESTTELYDVPPADVYPDLAGLAGGAGPLVERARARLEGGEPLHALHLVEVALSGEPAHRGALEARLAVLEALAAEFGTRNFQEAGWLRYRIAQARAALESAP